MFPAPLLNNPDGPSRSSVAYKECQVLVIEKSFHVPTFVLDRPLQLCENDDSAQTFIVLSHPVCVGFDAFSSTDPEQNLTLPLGQ